MNKILYSLNYAGRIMIWAKQHGHITWFPVADGEVIEEELFKDFDFQIRNVIYTEWSEEFEAEMAWELLKANDPV